MARNVRIAIGQIASESNHFVRGFAVVEFFRQTGYLYEGAEVLRLSGTDTELGGALATFAADGGVEAVPLLATRGNSSGPLSAACFAELKGRLLDALRRAGRVDGVLLSHHGSMCAEGVDDTEGDVIESVRAIVGPDVPIAVTLDMHAHVTERMVRGADLIVSYRHYPHDDVAGTGRRGAELLLRTVRGELTPAMALAKVPMILTAFNASTRDPSFPFAGMIRRAESLEANGSVVSASMLLVGSYIDVPDMGCGALVVTDGDPDSARRQVEGLAREFWALRREFAVQPMSVAEAVRRGREIEGGPVLLLDTADTTGGGAAGDGAGLIRSLIEIGVTEPSLAMVVDPAGARACHEAGAGATVRLRLGHQLDPTWGTPVDVTGVVRRLSSGAFRYVGGILGGTTASMGPSAVLEVGALQILVMSNPTYDWACEQYESVGLDPAAAKFVGVKNMMNFRTGYGDIMKAYFVLDLPGPTPADMRLLPFRRVTRPVFPLDEIREPKVEVVCR